MDRLSLSLKKATGVLSLPSEVRLAIFGEVFHKADEDAMIHPLLHVCRRIRLEYITTLSRKITIRMIEWYSGHYTASIPRFTIVRDHDNRRILPRKLHTDMTIYARRSRRSQTCKYGHPRPSNEPAYIKNHYKEEEFVKFIESPFAWMIEHTRGVRFEPMSDRPWIGYEIVFDPAFTAKAFLEVDLMSEFELQSSWDVNDAVLKQADHGIINWETLDLRSPSKRKRRKIGKRSPENYQRAWIQGFMAEFDGKKILDTMMEILQRAQRGTDSFRPLSSMHRMTLCLGMIAAIEAADASAIQDT